MTNVLKPQSSQRVKFVQQTNSVSIPKVATNASNVTRPVPVAQEMDLILARNVRKVTSKVEMSA